MEGEVWKQTEKEFEGNQILAGLSGFNKEKGIARCIT